MSNSDLYAIFDSGDASLYSITTTTEGPSGQLPITADELTGMRSGDLFGWTQNVAMGLNPKKLTGREYLILSTMGGLRGPDGEAIALGYHTGHWELGLLVEAAAREFTKIGAIPFAAQVSDPCDGRTNGTEGMLHSLPYRNDAAIVLRRLAESLPNRAGLLGVATCDKGLPAMMMAAAGLPHLPSVIVPGGVTLLSEGAENTAVVQTLATRFARGEISLDYAATMGCKACGSAGGGCHFMGTAATSQVVAEALGLTLPHSALIPSGSDLWLDMARRSARALDQLTLADGAGSVLTDASIRNAMVVHAAVGGSTNLFLHLPAIAHAAGLKIPSVDEWTAINRAVPRIVDCLPNGPKNYATVHAYLAGGVPEIMLGLAEQGHLDLTARTVSGFSLGENLQWWKDSDRRRLLRERLRTVEQIDPDDVIYPTSRPALGGTVTFVRGNLAPDGAIIKSTSLAPEIVDSDGTFRFEGPVQVFTTEASAIAAIKNRSITAGEAMVLIGIGPSFGMPETYQITAALKHIDEGSKIPLLTDGRFSGVSTGPCIGHITPEASSGGPLGKLQDGDTIRIVVDTVNLIGSVDFVGDATHLNNRTQNPDLVDLEKDLPSDTRLWAALQAASGGSWAGCVYDVDAIVERLSASR